MDQLVKMVELNVLRSRPLVNPYHHKYAYIERDREEEREGLGGGGGGRERDKESEKEICVQPN
jgi:hypothetical protein